MAQRTPNYALVLVTLILAIFAASWAREKPTLVLSEPNLAAFPSTIGRWTGQDMTIASDVRKALNADQVLSRSYTNAKSENCAGLLVVYRNYGRRDFIHRPELCYPAAGWRIVGVGTTSVPYAGKTVTARKVIAERDGARDIVVYWFASGRRTESDYMKQQMWMALDRFQTRKYGWAFIRVNCPVTVSDEETLKTVRSFVGEISPTLERNLMVTKHQ